MIEVIKSVTVSDAIQIAVLYLAFYAVLKGAKGSRFGQALLGIGVLASLSVLFTIFFHFDVLSQIIRSLLLYMAISSVVIFQPEIRRFLQTVGAFGYLEKPKHQANGAATPELIVDTLIELAKARMGALVAFERGISLRAYESTGVATDAIFTPELVKSIFTPPMPLHDGGVIMRDGRISSAHCIFPVSNNPDLIASGMRHRAAVGLSEETDAMVMVVSEERGQISVARNGRLFRYSPQQRESLIRWVIRAMPGQTQDEGFMGKLLVPLQKLFVRNTKSEEAPQ